LDDQLKLNGISTPWLKSLRILHLEPIKVVVFDQPLSTILRSGRYLILGWASCLDAFSAYPFRT